MPKISLKKLFTRANHLKLMVDYCIIDPEIVDALRQIKTLDVKTTLECGYHPWTADETLVAGTTEKDRLLITANYRDITPARYPPCKHGGIILIKHPSPSGQIVFERMRSFALKGGRSHAKGHVTYLNADTAEIRKLDEEIIKLQF